VWFRVGSFGVLIMPVFFVFLTATVINQEREFRWPDPDHRPASPPD
jgi:hypothetical protein